MGYLIINWFYIHTALTMFLLHGVCDKIELR